MSESDSPLKAAPDRPSADAYANAARRQAHYVTLQASAPLLATPQQQQSTSAVMLQPWLQMQFVLQRASSSWLCIIVQCTVAVAAAAMSLMGLLSCISIRGPRRRSPQANTTTSAAATATAAATAAAGASDVQAAAADPAASFHDAITTAFVVTANGAHGATLDQLVQQQQQPVRDTSDTMSDGTPAVPAHELVDDDPAAAAASPQPGAAALTSTLRLTSVRSLCLQSCA